ncbi:MAG: (2Fe-2S)-binding protein [Pseudomonadota bacterium]
MKLSINDSLQDVPAGWETESLLTLLRDGLGLTGTKFGCGKGLCGACTVHVDGAAARACLLPVQSLRDARITTIEGLSDGSDLHPVQQAWIECSVPQCGYCQAGQIMTAAAFLAQNATPSKAEVAQAMNGNLCRCGTYTRICAGTLRAAELAQELEA